MNRLYPVLALVLCVGCGHSPVAPEAAAPVVATLGTITYAINLPDRQMVQEQLAAHPNGILLAPMTAQRRYDYTLVYHSANVYYGPLAPALSVYALAGIVVAPPSVASQDAFNATEWPNEFGQPFGSDTRYQWLGRFTYVAVGVQP